MGKGRDKWEGVRGKRVWRDGRVKVWRGEG
jgi:hypothetical protein